MLQSADFFLRIENQVFTDTQQFRKEEFCGN